MILALVLLYVVSLVYISITERFRSYASLVGLQGWLLLAIALVRLQQIEIWSLLFVVAETLLFKAIVVPAILFAVIRRTKINRIAASGTSQFNSLVLSLAALVASISVTYCIAEETINLVFFGVALYALLSGLILIVVRTRIFSHMVGFLVIENGVFLFSMAVGVEMPSMIEIAIMLDILISFAAIFSAATPVEVRFTIILLLLGYLLTKIFIVEQGRIPVDDPRTHLELTMIHEVMCLDYGGIDLAFIQIAGWLKGAALAVLAADTLLLGGALHWWWAAPLAVLLPGLAVGVVESTQARNKLSRNATFLLTIAALAALIFFVALLLHLNIDIR